MRFAWNTGSHVSTESVVSCRFYSKAGHVRIDCQLHPPPRSLFLESFFAFTFSPLLANVAVIRLIEWQQVNLNTCCNDHRVSKKLSPEKNHDDWDSVSPSHRSNATHRPSSWKKLSTLYARLCQNYYSFIYKILDFSQQKHWKFGYINKKDYHLIITSNIFHILLFTQIMIII